MLRGKRQYIYYIRGRAFMKLKQYQKAQADFTVATTFSPKFALAHYRLGQSYERLGLRTWAIRAYRTAYKLKPSDKDYARAVRRLGAR